MSLISRTACAGVFTAVATFASFGQAAPILDQSQTNIGTVAGAGFFAGDGVNYKVGQQITPTLDYLDQVDIEATGFAGSTLVTLSIYGSAGNYGVPESGALLGAVTLTASAAGTLSFDFSALPIDVSSYGEDAGLGRVSLVLTANDYFNPYISANSGGAASNYGVNRGNRWQVVTLDGAWSGPFGTDMYFLEYGHDAVPEPATLGLLGLGAVTLLGRRRSRS